MNISATELEGVLIIQAKKFSDERGFFSEVYREDSLRLEGVEDNFVQTNHVYSKGKGVLRGLHFQKPPFAQAKLVRVIRGAIYDVAVDLRLGSKSYGNWLGVELSAENWKQLYIPAGFAHGYVTLEEDTDVEYKVSECYHPEADSGLAWDDEDLAIDWNLGGITPVMSEKDLVNQSFSEFKSEFHYG